MTVIKASQEKLLVALLSSKMVLRSQVVQMVPILAMRDFFGKC